MKILLFANEFPYPPNHGGKSDIWNKIIAFKSLGYSVLLVTWFEVVKNDIPNDESIEVVREVVDELVMFPIRRDYIRIINLLKMPSLVAARILSNADLQFCERRAKSFMPDIVFVDGIYAGDNGLRFARMLNIPLGVRLHNVEHAYMNGQYKLAKTFKQKMVIGLALLHLKRYEEAIIKSSNAFFDISLADLKLWQAKGYGHGSWLPPVVPSSRSILGDSPSFLYDICFLGNLNTPNNVNGLVWFIKDVLPLLKNEDHEVTMLIMGSMPSQEILDLCKTNTNIVLIANPIRPEIYLERSHILINPVNFSSGVNIKAVDMLFTDKPVVTTSHGLKGLPDIIKEAFCVADNASEFAHAINSNAQEQLSGHVNVRLKLRKMFYYSNVKIVKDTLCKSGIPSNV